MQPLQDYITICVTFEVEHDPYSSSFNYLSSVISYIFTLLTELCLHSMDLMAG